MAGVYIHIPFCKKRCIYCDFYSTTFDALKDSYMDALKCELTQRRDYCGNEAVETIYFGGGTPSQLPPHRLQELIAQVEDNFPTTKGMEITVELNPDDLTEEYVHQLRQTDINRLSIGIQTFDEEKLRFLRRRHTAAAAIQAVERCQRAGYANISIDLIYGLPGENGAAWEKDLDTAIRLGVQHLSAYHLIYEEGTSLHRLLAEHKVEEVDEDESLAQFETMNRKLRQAGFERYEISNFCKPGFHSRHNSSYWSGRKYIGCGPSAHSFDGASRQWNISDLREYIRRIADGENYFEKEILDADTQYNELIITSLRTTHGLCLKKVRSRFGQAAVDYLMQNASPHLCAGALTLEGEMLRISESGIFLSDGIMSDLLKA